ncbi:MAG TPA: glycosyltransferase [Rhizomicrobium sp.]|nr:glycosyltransferase [Rhizomicrobium sp.]
MRVLQRAPRKALILSPVASHPQDFGNRRRVYQTCEFLCQQGYEIHFLLYPMEPDWMARVQDAARDMRREWDSFQVIPASRPFPLQSPAIGEHHTIDEWWDPTIGTHLSWLFEREHFDLFVVNYVFMSKALEYAGLRTVKVLEAHDRFAGRKELLLRLHARIESFYTTESEEKIALDRSDIVIAIKESEAEFYASLTDREVISVPFWQDQPPRSRRPMEGNADVPLRAGFIGALNVVNVANMEAFLAEFESRHDIAAAPLLFDIAGEVCEFLDTRHPQVRLLGRVESLDEFYDSLDVVAVPMTLSTGLKIKTGEALAFGKAVVAMDDGFDGFPAVDEFHTLDSFAATCAALVALASNRPRLAKLEWRSRISALLARRRKEAGYRKLAAAILRVEPKILFVTDLPVFEEGNAQVERLAQWCQLCTGVAATMIGYLGEGVPTAPRPELLEVEIVAMGDDSAPQDSANSAWDKLARRYNIIEVVLSVDGSLAPQLLQIARSHCLRVILDTWRSALAATTLTETALPVPDYWQDWEQGTDVLVSATALRYRPRLFEGWRAKRAEGSLAILCGPDSKDRNGVEILIDGITNIEPEALTLAAAPDAPFERDFFARLLAGRRPRLFFAIGRNAAAHALCEAIGIIFRTPCLHFSDADLPILLQTEDGMPVLCETYADIARHAGDPERLAEILPIHRSDTGWNIYKERLIDRLASADRRAAGSASDGMGR